MTGEPAALAALSRVAGMELAAYRDDHVSERVRSALAHERVASVEQLVEVLTRNPEARTRFRRSVAISVSGLFRDPEQFELLESELLPELLARRPRLRVWSAGCADGSELYSVAVILERLGALERSLCLGSDLLDENVAAARRGEYGATVVPPPLRARVRWERRDVVRDGAPPGRWDLVLCRNVAIYLAPEAKNRLHGALVDALFPGGVLLLGRSERVSDPRGLGLVRAGPHAYRRSAP